ncbi:hypothetical protein B0A48_16659 [Cryoendolithus antarcticus]|uniref:F-box domain-containing protein n=1 Tax=Cryoendolithus antarcticus TaxID=1507870 RepID=A0A1V8SEC9_9PEZI|nr:hypothetical protein B0A48_16659 [Cryoendolithus antarcticus]
MASTAVARAIGITEILELILLHLDTKTLLLSQRVSKDWKNVIASSHILQVALYFRQSETPPHVGFENLNSLLAAGCEPPGARWWSTARPLEFAPESSAMWMYPFSHPSSDDCIYFADYTRLGRPSRFRRGVGTGVMEDFWIGGLLCEWVDYM